MRVFFFVVSAFILNACAQRLDEIEARMDELDDRTKILESRSGLPVGSDRELLESRKLADVRTQLAAMRNELTVLQGKVEAVEFETKALKDQNSQAFTDFEQRLVGLEKKLEASQSHLDPVESIYQKALTLHQNGSFNESRRQFEAFVKANPSHPLADNALYWMGEGYMSERDYRRALVQFQDLIEKYPQSDKKCDAMDRQVEAFRALDMKEEAKAYADLRTEACRNR